jgi:hypothetical protein
VDALRHAAPVFADFWERIAIDQRDALISYREHARGQQSRYGAPDDPPRGSPPPTDSTSPEPRRTPGLVRGLCRAGNESEHLLPAKHGGRRSFSPGVLRAIIAGRLCGPMWLFESTIRPCTGHAVQLALDPQERPGACYGGSNGAGIPCDCARQRSQGAATVKILEYKDMEPFFVQGESDEP